MRRICVVGAGGQIGGVHLESLLQLKEAGHLKGWGISVCSGNPDVRGGDLSQSSNNLGIKVRKAFDPIKDDVLIFEDFDDVLDSWDVAAVIIASPTLLHAEQTIEGIASCKAVLVEKPLGLNIPAIACVLQEIEEQVNIDLPPYVGVGHVLPYFDAYRALLQSVQFARNAEETSVAAQFRRTLFAEHPFVNPEKAGEIGSPWLDLSVHDIHLMLQLFGEPAEFAVAPKSVRVSPADRSYLLRCKAEFKYEWGVASVDAGIEPLQSDPFAHAFCVEQEDGDAFVMSSTETSWEARCRSTQVPLFIPPPLTGVSPDIMPFALEQHDFIQGIQSGEVPKFLCPYTAAQAVQYSVMVQEAAVSSLVM